MITLQEFVRQLKDKVDLVEVIEKTSAYRFERKITGRYLSCTHPNSLKVDPDWGVYTWFAKPGAGGKQFETGDVFNWLERYGGMEFKEGVRYVAELTHTPIPGELFREQDEQALKSQRVREEALEIGMRWMMGRLAENAAAIRYCERRGWVRETIEAAHLGFCDGSEEGRQDLIKELKLYELDVRKPECVLLVGLRGGARAWCDEFHIEPQDNWLKHDRIWGLADFTGLVYAHRVHGRMRYVSMRRLVWEGAHADAPQREADSSGAPQHGADPAEGEYEGAEKAGEPKSYNPTRGLGGERAIYYNHLFSRGQERVVVVEGQGDAISLGQLGVAAIALCGLGMGDDLISQLGVALQKGKTMLFLGVDGDAEGQKALNQRLGNLHPLTRLVSWPKASETDKDANDWLKAMVKAELTEDEMWVRMGELLDGAQTVVEFAAGRVEGLEGVAYDKAVQLVKQLLRRIPHAERGDYLRRIAKKIGWSPSALKNDLQAADKREAAEQAKDEKELVDYRGGVLEDHFVEIIFDRERMEGQLAIRYPDGQVKEAPHFDVEKMRYMPWKDELMTRGVVLYPSRLGNVRSTADLLREIRTFIHKYLDVDIFYEKLASYYVLFTWLYDCFPVLPYLRALGDYGTGKTRMIMTIGAVCYRPTLTVGASSFASVFRIVDRHRGTLIFDEADFSSSDETAMVTKYLNIRYMKNMPLLRTVDRGMDGFQVEAYECYGPTLLATRRRWGDQALESRCLTKEMGQGVPRAEIPILLTQDFWDKAQEIRNDLLAFRMKFWKREWNVDYDKADRSVEPRLNQVTLALKNMALEVGGDEGEHLVKDVDSFIREYNRQSVTERAGLFTARILEGVVQAGKEHLVEVETEEVPTKAVLSKDVAAKVNQIIDEMNRKSGDEEGEEYGEGAHSGAPQQGSTQHGGPQQGEKKREPVKSRKVNDIVRKFLQLRTGRFARGEAKGLFYVIWDEEKIRGLCSRYGVDFEKEGEGMGEHKGSPQQAVLDLNHPAPATLEAMAEARRAWKEVGGEGPEPWEGSDESQIPPPEEVE